MSTVRLFYALWPSPSLAASLAQWAQVARPVCGGRVMRTETLHLTLAFLGPVDVQLADTLAAATPEHRLPQGQLALDHFGVFKRQRILWAGPRDTPAALQAAHDDLWQWLADYGLAAPPQPFRPHVTLLRNIEHAPPTDGLALAEAAEPLLWRYDRMVLVASESLTGGSRYRIVAQSRPLEP
ncbi:2'-5' RNA ligase [Achromobacter piechaudii]|uniref:RNA 2',3'-cyclic phosphodiesterase n=1 Tax=Achromobacter piechaudii TaxID=72556 RepID=A0ABM8KTL0_9BURK|nr:RNA 2',3'-cyclic phosphodiesterase [Achromobacter piechaudii]KNY11845.1 2'-5' RNA ligase [Achromobacter piechaudii]CAB3673567.1 RNA 2',3'-cyclic phosphodiesterase [Achromobacter piechaudii]CAB3838360.1 RNA 2',3'-cyclic phosphodiesterase [Achromobacter piechaudii]CAB3942774.1 RNA 2',3'-cyclic phosphodiesterase [Achromobacter piechaudii]